MKVAECELCDFKWPSNKAFAGYICRDCKEKFEKLKSELIAKEIELKEVKEVMCDYCWQLWEHSANDPEECKKRCKKFTALDESDIVVLSKEEVEKINCEIKALLNRAGLIPHSRIETHMIPILNIFRSKEKL